MTDELSKQDKIAKMTLENSYDSSAMVAISILIGAIYFILASSVDPKIFGYPYVFKGVLVAIALVCIYNIKREYDRKLKEIKEIFAN